MTNHYTCKSRATQSGGMTHEVSATGVNATGYDTINDLHFLSVNAHDATRVRVGAPLPGETFSLSISTAHGDVDLCVFGLTLADLATAVANAVEAADENAARS